MGVDESFRQPGSVPFKWEIRPGVPKVKQPGHHQRSSAITNPPLKLRPPPSSPRPSYIPTPPPPDFRTGSFRSAPRSRSDRWNIGLGRSAPGPDVVSVGCFPAPLMSRKDIKKRIVKLPEPIDILARRSISVRRTRSPFLASPVSSYSSYGSSPRPMKDADWAGFGLF